MTKDKRQQAQKLLNLASDLERDGKIDKALDAFKRAIDADPTWSVPYYDLGLFHKYRGEWEASLALNTKAAMLDSSDDAAWWNMGIAATALKNWQMARMAWQGFGIPIPKGEPVNSELRMRIGVTPVRLRTNSEVVWGDRIDPARIMVQNIPTPASNRRFRDIVLHDGAPNGYRKVNGQDVPVFDELELFEQSEYKTFSVWVQLKNIKQLESLEKICEKNDIGFENWSTMLRYICKQCSEGRPHETHDKDLPQKTPDGQYHVAIASKNDTKMDFVLSEWRTKVEAEILELERVL